METLLEIKNNYAQEQGYEDWENLQFDTLSEGEEMEGHMDEICIRAQKAAMEVGQTYPSAIVDSDRIKGIPLTKDMLLKYGFKKINGSSRWFFAFQGRYHYVYKDGYKWRYVFEVNGQDLILNQTGFEYLHQLQNLVYLLTGEELKLK